MGPPPFSESVEGPVPPLLKGTLRVRPFKLPSRGSEGGLQPLLKGLEGSDLHGCHGPRSGSVFWRRKTCRFDFVKAKKSLQRARHNFSAPLLGEVSHIRVHLSAELPWPHRSFCLPLGSVEQQSSCVLPLGNLCVNGVFHKPLQFCAWTSMNIAVACFGMLW